jgi:hypothetical protein
VGIEECGGDPEHEKDGDRRRRRTGGPADDRPYSDDVEARDQGREREERERAFEEEVGEREPVVLLEDRERERYRRVMADDLDPVRLGAAAVAAQVERGDGEEGERERPYGAASPRLAARDGEERDDEQAEPRRQELERPSVATVCSTMVSRWRTPATALRV